MRKELDRRYYYGICVASWTYFILRMGIVIMNSFVNKISLLDTISLSVDIPVILVLAIIYTIKQKAGAKT